jgi:hypothetical protein
MQLVKWSRSDKRPPFGGLHYVSAACGDANGCARKRIEEMGDKVAERSRFNIRALASVALFSAGVWLVPSGIALHFATHDGAAKWSHLFMSIHNTASFLFLIAAVVHVIMNWNVLTH